VGITIDSQIWIYYFDPNADEHKNVCNWIDDVLTNENISLSVIIPMEVAHRLYRIKDLSKSNLDRLLLKWITKENIDIISADHRILLISLELMKKYQDEGVGGRDCVILASMFDNKIDTIVTHDKNFLKITNIKRIDPVEDPPIVLNINQEYIE